MKKFIFKISVFFVIVILPFLILNALYVNTNYWKTANELYDLKVYPDKITLLNLGNSHEDANLRYDKYYDGVAHNFATSSQPFYYDYSVLKHVEKSLAPGAVVIVPISYFDWYYNYEELFAVDTAAYNKRYYSMLRPSEMYNYNFEDRVKYGILPVLSAKTNLKYIWNDINLPSGETVDNRVVKDVNYASDWKAKSLKENVMAPGSKKADTFETNKYYFQKIIDYCYEKGYKPVVIVSPVTKALNNHFDESFMADFDAKNKSVLAKYPGILFLDYSRDTYFTDNTSFFRDSDHMNSAGANAFTPRVLSDMANAGVISKDLLKAKNP